jgi:hypothetical protein
VTRVVRSFECLHARYILPRLRSRLQLAGVVTPGQLQTVSAITPLVVYKYCYLYGKKTSDNRSTLRYAYRVGYSGYLCWQRVNTPQRVRAVGCCQSRVDALARK